MAINGSLDEASLTDVLQLLSLGRKTGRLSVSDQSNLGHIFLDSGRITQAFLATRRDRLGDILFKSGHITQDQLSEALRLQEVNPEKKFGEILVEIGATSSTALKQHIQVQIEEAVYFLFTWRRGDFVFERDAKPANQDFEISIDPESLLLEGARRVDEWSVIEKKIPSFDMVFRADHARIEASDAKLSEEQKRIAKLLDGERNLAAIVEDTGMIQFEVGKALYGLITAGFAEPVEPGQKDSASGVVIDDAAGHLDNEKLLAYLAHQAEYADPELRKQSRLHITDCPTCSKRLQEIHVRRSQGLPAIPNEAAAAALGAESTPQPTNRRSGSDRRRSGAGAPYDPKADRRVHGAGDRRSSARVAAVQGSGPTERRRRPDRRSKERRRGERRKSVAVDRSDRHAVERRRGLERRLRERRIEMRRFADIRMHAKGGARQAAALGTGTGPAATPRVTMAGSAYSGAGDNGQNSTLVHRLETKREAKRDSSLQPTVSETLGGAAQSSPRIPTEADEPNQQSTARDQETTVQTSVQKPENTASSGTPEQTEVTQTESSSEVTHRQEPQSKAPDSVPEQPPKRATRPSVRRGRESPLRGIPLLADGTEWVFVDRTESEDQEQDSKSKTVDLDVQVPKPAVKGKEAEPEPPVAPPEAETTAVMPIAATPPPSDALQEQQSPVRTPDVDQGNQEVEKAKRELAIAKSEAEKARLEAEEAKAEAEKAKRVAEQAKKTAEQAKAEADKAAKTAESEKSDAAKRKTEARQTKLEAEKATTLAKRTTEAAERAKLEAERAKRTAEQAKSEAEMAATKAESEKSVAAKRKTEARQTKLEAEKATTLASRTLEEAERAKLEAEREKRVAEQERKQAEKTKKEAEKAKSAAEKAAAKARKSKPAHHVPEPPAPIQETVVAVPEEKVAAPVGAGVVDTDQAVDQSARSERGRKRPVFWLGMAALAIVATGLGWLARPLLESGFGSDAISASGPGQATALNQPPLDEVPVVVSDTLREDSLPGGRAADSMESLAVELATEAEMPVREQQEALADSERVQTAPTPVAVPPEVEESVTRQEPTAETPPTPAVVEEPDDSVSVPEDVPTAIAFFGTVREIGTNAPLAGVLVSITEMGIATTTDARGAFAFDSISAGSLTVTADIEGYVPGRETIVAELGENVELDIVVHHPPEALEPDEEVNTGPWAVTDRAGAESVLGRPVAVISGLWLESLARPASGNRPRVRVSHLSESGERITLIVSRSGPPNRAAAPRVTALRIIPPTEAYPITTGTASFGGLLVTAKAALPVDSLRGMLQRLVEASGG